MSATFFDAGLLMPVNGTGLFLGSSDSMSDIASYASHKSSTVRASGPLVDISIDDANLGAAVLALITFIRPIDGRSP